MSEKPFFFAFRTKYVCLRKPPSKTQIVYFMTTFFCMAYITVPRRTRVRMAILLKRVERTCSFFTHLSVTRLNQESTKYESKRLRSAVMISGIAVESSHAAHSNRSDFAHAGMLNLYVHILI